MIYSMIKINDTDILRPNDFSLHREDIYAAEITTCTGKTIADRIGWRYADMTLEWDMLPQESLDLLLSMTGQCSITFTDADGQIHTESIVRASAVMTSTRTITASGKPVWKDVRVEVRFINAHN